MGIDLLDLGFRAEHEFESKLSRDDMEQMLKDGYTSNPSERTRTDVRVADYVKLVEMTIRQQHGEPGRHVYDRVKKQMIECFSVEDSGVFPDAWMVRDLGMESSGRPFAVEITRWSFRKLKVEQPEAWNMKIAKIGFL